MASGRVRDPDELRAGLARWVAAHGAMPPVALAGRASAPAGPPTVCDLVHADSGLANETVLLDLGEGHPGLAVRLPPLEPTFAHYDLEAQATVQNAVARAGVPAPAPAVAVEETEWIGSPFLVMPRLRGHIPGPAPLFDPWIADAAPQYQRALSTAFVDMLAAIHSVDWSGCGLGGILPGTTAADALAYWDDYIMWASEGSPARALDRGLRWCEERRAPGEAPGAPVLVWGDPRLGNLVYAEDCSVRAVLDWELAAIGPRGVDLGWFLGLEAMMLELFGRAVPGFLTRSETLERYVAATGHTVDDAELVWHEIFALVRALAINDCQRRVAASSGRRYVGGSPASDPDSDPLAKVLLSRIEAAT